MAKGYKQPSSPRGGGMMSQFAKLQEQMAQAQEELAEATVTETVGGGAISITMSGDQQCRAITISPDLLADADVEMLQDLLLSGVNKALESSRSLSEEKMAPFTNMLGGLGLGR
jgi:DNA-binding YbaB/EbfC family protein